MTKPKRKNREQEIIEYFQNWKPENGKNDFVSIEGIIESGALSKKLLFLKSIAERYLIYALSFSFKEQRRWSDLDFSDTFSKIEDMGEKDLKLKDLIITETPADVWLILYENMLDPWFFYPSYKLEVVYYMHALYLYYSLIHSMGKISLTAFSRMENFCQLIMYFAGHFMSQIYLKGKRETDRTSTSRKTKVLRKQMHIGVIKSIYKNKMDDPKFRNLKYPGQKAQRIKQIADKFDKSLLPIQEKEIKNLMKEAGLN